MKYVILKKAKPYTRIKRGKLERVRGYNSRLAMIQGAKTKHDLWELSTTLDKESPITNEEDAAMWSRKQQIDYENEKQEVETKLHAEMQDWGIDPSKYFFDPKLPLRKHNIGDMSMDGNLYDLPGIGWIAIGEGITVGGDPSRGEEEQYDMKGRVMFSNRKDWLGKYVIDIPELQNKLVEEWKKTTDNLLKESGDWSKAKYIPKGEKPQIQGGVLFPVQATDKTAKGRSTGELVLSGYKESMKTYPWNAFLVVMGKKFNNQKMIEDGLKIIRGDLTGLYIDKDEEEMQFIKKLYPNEVGKKVRERKISSIASLMGDIEFLNGRFKRAISQDAVDQLYSMEVDNQKLLQKKFGDSVTLYRGIGDGDYANEVNKALKADKSINITTNSLTSWTEDINVARYFGKVILHKTIPTKNIWMSHYASDIINTPTGVGTMTPFGSTEHMDEKEFIMQNMAQSLTFRSDEITKSMGIAFLGNIDEDPVNKFWLKIKQKYVILKKSDTNPISKQAIHMLSDDGYSVWAALPPRTRPIRSVSPMTPEQQKAQDELDAIANKMTDELWVILEEITEPKGVYIDHTKDRGVFFDPLPLNKSRTTGAKDIKRRKIKLSKTRIKELQAQERRAQIVFPFAEKLGIIKSHVKGHTRTRRGKLERVNPFERKGEKTVYHGTSFDRIQKIIDEGIQSKDYHNWNSAMFEGERAGKVFVALGKNGFDLAQQFAIIAANQTGKVAVIVEAKVPNDYFEKNAEVDPNLGGIISKGAWMLPEVKAEWITNIYDKKGNVATQTINSLTGEKFKKSMGDMVVYIPMSLKNLKKLMEKK